MTLDQANLLKFGILALPNFQYFPKIDRPFDLGEGVFVLTGPLEKNLEKDSIKHWASWIGSLEWDSVKNRKVYLQIVKSSLTTKVNDHENIELSAILNDAYLALMIAAPLRSVEGRPITCTGYGSLEDGRIRAENISTISRSNEWTESHYMSARGYHKNRKSHFSSRKLLKQWKSIFQNLRKIRKKRKGTEALMLAVHSLRAGLETNYLDFRIPLFVRTSEGILAPRKNKTKMEFVARASKLLLQAPHPMFTSKRTDISLLIDDIFELRNGCVHGMPFGWKIRKRIKSKRRLLQYAFLSEECARRALRFALQNEGLIKASANRKKLEEWCVTNF